MIDRSSFRFLDTVTRTCLNSTFSNNLSWDMCSFSESFSKVCDQGSNVSLDLWCVNFMFHQNWQVRMCCVVRFWAVWTFLAFFKKKNLNICTPNWQLPEKKSTYGGKDFPSVTYYDGKWEDPSIMQHWIKIDCVESALSFWEIRRIFVKFENAVQFELTISSCEFRLGFQMAIKILK